MNQLRQRLTGVSPYCYLIPCFAVFGMFLFYPFFKTIYLSLFLTDKLGRAKIFVGLENYERMFQNNMFLTAFGNTLKFLGIGLPLILILASPWPVLKASPGGSPCCGRCSCCPM